MWFSGSANSLITTLTLAPVTLPANAYLDFQTNFDIEPYYDYGVVQISTNGGVSWANLYSPDICAFNNGQIFGWTGEWVPAHYDLSAYAGQSVRIRFYYKTDWIETYPGWYVDEILLAAPGVTLFSHGAEADSTGLTAVGWARVQH
jgi:immune inhibitor A